MDEHTFKVLEFDKVKSLLSAFCISSLGQELCEELTPLVDKEIIEHKLKSTTELKEVLLFEEKFPLSRVKDIRPYLKKLGSEGTFLEPAQLLDLAETLPHIEPREPISSTIRYRCPNAVAGSPVHPMDQYPVQ